MEKSSNSVVKILLMITIVAILCLIAVIIVQQNKINELNGNINSIASREVEEKLDDNENQDVVQDSGEIDDHGDYEEEILNEDTSNLRKIVVNIDTKNIERNISNDDTDLDYDILYDGVKITEKVGVHSCGWDDGFADTAENRAKYNQTYYSYETNGYMREIKEPKIESGIIDEGNAFITNVARIAVSKKYDVMPRTLDFDFEYYNEEEGKCYDFYNNIKDYYKDRNLFIMNQPDDAKIDLNGDGNPIYIRLSVEKVLVERTVDGEHSEEYVGVAFNYDVFDKDGNHLNTLLSQVYDIRYLNPNSDTTFSSLREDNSVTCADLDNDSKMEILIEAPWYEFGSDIYVYKYENGKIIGNTEAVNLVSA